MSVLIKGMEKPKGNITKVDVIFHLEEDASLMSVRESVEPIQVVDVPTPHGRLIDADGIDRAFSDSRWEDGDWRTGKLKHWGDRPDWCLTGAEVERLITAAPTIIEAEEGAEHEKIKL